jgi:hypothetical protein
MITPGVTVEYDLEEVFTRKQAVVAAPLTADTKFCVKCRHCEMVPTPPYAGPLRCRALMRDAIPPIVDLVSGIILSKPATEPSACSVLRDQFGTCGPEGKLWEAAL